MNTQRPNLITIIGDLVDGSVPLLADATEPVRELRSTHGTFFVIGNHECYFDHARWVEHVRTLGVRPLLNQRTTITHNGGAFELAGVTEPTAYMADAEEPDVGKAVRGWDGQRAVVLLSHQPNVVEQATEHGVDLQLSGHTHGGQMFPFHLALALTQDATAGLSTVRNTQLYVTRGTGCWGPPVRVGAPQDISMIELVSSS